MPFHPPSYMMTPVYPFSAALCAHTLTRPPSLIPYSHHRRKLFDVGRIGCGGAGLRLIVVHCLVSRYGMSCQLACQTEDVLLKTACLIAPHCFATATQNT
jgi:hypothetical protein